MSGRQLAMTSIGTGYNTFTGGACASALLISPGQTSPGTATSSMTAQVCTSYESVCTALGISASFSVASMFQENPTATSHLDMTTTSVAVVIRAASSTPTTLTATPSPAEGMQAPTTATEVNSFFQQYGDSYVSSLELGGVYVAIYVFHCQSTPEQQSLQSSLAALNGSLGSSTSTVLSSALTNPTTNWTCHQYVSGAAGSNLPSPQDTAALITFALAFPASAAQATPAVISFTTTGYEQLPSFQTPATQAAFAQVIANRNTFTQTIAPTVVALVGVQNQIGSILNVYDTYGGFDDSVLIANGRTIVSSIQLMKKWVDAIDQNPTVNPENAADVAQINTALGYGSPTLSYQMSSAQSLGAAGGVPFMDICASPVVPAYPSAPAPIPIMQLPVLVSVQLYGSTTIAVMQCQYVTKSPPQLHTFKHGTTQSSGGWGPALNLQSGEFIVAIGGSTSSHLHQLSFMTNYGQNVTFPPGSVGVVPFQWFVPNGSTLVGFQGHSSWDLHQLIPILITFQPATWTPAQPQVNANPGTN